MALINAPGGIVGFARFLVPDIKTFALTPNIRMSLHNGIAATIP
jgi:hypothetical protein